MTKGYTELQLSVMGDIVCLLFSKLSSLVHVSYFVYSERRLSPEFEDIKHSRWMYTTLKVDGHCCAWI